MTVLTLMFLGPEQWRIACCVALFAALSWGLGRVVGARGLLAAAFGFLVLASGASLAMLGFRQFDAPLTWFGPAAMAATATVALTLRLALPPLLPQPPVNRAWLVGIVAVLGLAVWTLRIIQLDPSASLSSHHGWYPLYIEGSFQLGRFAQVRDFAFGNGYLASIFYNLDLMGLVALGKWLGPFSAWQVYSAGSTLASLLAIAVVGASLRPSRLGLVVYAVMVLALLATDYLYRSTLARNWGDALLYLGGATMLACLTAGQDLRRTALWTAGAALFLVVARHYGAFYAGMCLGLGYLACWRLGRDGALGRWIVLGLMLIVLSAREVVCLLDPPSPYYPGTKLIKVASPPPSQMWEGTLNDLGLLNNSQPDPLFVAPHNLYLAAVAILIGLYGVHRSRPGLWLDLLPLALALLPQVLQHLLQYRSSPNYSKTTLIALHLFSWYPAHAAARAVQVLDWRPPARPRLWAAAGALVVAAGLGTAGLAAAGRAERAGVPVRQGPGAVLDWAFTLYRDHNVDLNIARLLRQNKGDEGTARIAARPILYLHYEPGLSLRHYIGGTFFCDYDFWGPGAAHQAGDAADLAELIARLGYPAVYFSFGEQLLYNRYNPDFFDRFAADLAQAQSRGAATPWVDTAIAYDKALLLIPKRPADAPLPPCPARRASP